MRVSDSCVSRASSAFSSSGCPCERGVQRCIVVRKAIDTTHAGRANDQIVAIVVSARPCTESRARSPGAPGPHAIKRPPHKRSCQILGKDNEVISVSGYNFYLGDNRKKIPALSVHSTCRRPLSGGRNRLAWWYLRPSATEYWLGFGCLPQSSRSLPSLDKFSLRASLRVRRSCTLTAVGGSPGRSGDVVFPLKRSNLVSHPFHSSLCETAISHHCQRLWDRKLIELPLAA